jgi:hypothetical protein
LRTAFLITLPLLVALFLVSRPLNRGHGAGLVPVGVTRNLNP